MSKVRRVSILCRPGGKNVIGKDYADVELLAANVILDDPESVREPGIGVVHGMLIAVDLSQAIRAHGFGAGAIDPVYIARTTDDGGRVIELWSIPGQGAPTIDRCFGRLADESGDDSSEDSTYASDCDARAEAAYAEAAAIDADCADDDYGYTALVNGRVVAEDMSGLQTARNRARGEAESRFIDGYEAYSVEWEVVEQSTGRIVDTGILQSQGW